MSQRANATVTESPEHGFGVLRAATPLRCDAVAADPGEFLRPIAVQVMTHAADLAKAITVRILDEDPELGADAALVGSLRASVLDNVSTVLRVLELRSDPEAVRAPAAAVDYARRLAQHGVPISALLRTYRLGQAVFQQVVLTEISRADIDSATVAAAAEILSTVGFAYVDRISEEVVAAYQQEHDDWMRSRAAARSARVTALLGNTDADLVEVEKTLNYRLDQAHIALVAWTTKAPAADRLARVERAVTQISKDLASPRAPLTVVRDDSTVWAWLPRANVEPVTVAASADAAVRIAVGDPAGGADGFRRSHRQARHAQLVALTADVDAQRPVTAWADVGAVALMCADRDALADWVQDTLGGLATQDESMTRLRDTLSIFLSTGGSFTSSAQLLHMHKNTVQYRIRKAEEVLGRPLSARRRDVELALQACELLGASVLRPH
jgi:DNA-binding PucR family transcriptional regulator